MWLHNVDKHREMWIETSSWKETNSTYFLLLLEHKGKEVDVTSEWAVFMSTESKEIKTSFDIINIKGILQWSSSWESTCQCREHGFDPWLGKTPAAKKQLSPRTTPTEALVP